MKQASIPKRIVAFSIDFSIAMVIAHLVFWCFMSAGTRLFEFVPELRIAGFMVGTLLATTFALLYFVLLSVRSGEHNGQTIGKQTLGIKTIEAAEPFENITVDQVLRREAIAKPAVFMAYLFSMGFFALVDVFLFKSKHQKVFHDYMYKTQVVEVV